jgi:hypothetical protein
MDEKEKMPTIVFSSGAFAKYILQAILARYTHIWNMEHLLESSGF